MHKCLHLITLQILQPLCSGGVNQLSKATFSRSRYTNTCIKKVDAHAIASLAIRAKR